MTFKIILHALRMVFSNFSGTLRVTLLLYLMSQLVMVLAPLITTGEISFQIVLDRMALSQEMPSGAFWPALILAVIASVIFSTWMAVVWHRYVLLVESGSFVSNYPKGKVGSYFWTGVGLAFLAFVPAIVLMIIFILILGPGAAVGFVPSAAITFIAVYLLFRISMGLPGLCVDNPIPFSKSWEETKPIAGPLLGVALIVALVSGVLAQVALSTTGSVAMLPVTLALGWFQLVFGLSVLTTIYGVTIENRELT